MLHGARTKELNVTGMIRSICRACAWGCYLEVIGKEEKVINAQQKAASSWKENSRLSEGQLPQGSS